MKLGLSIACLVLFTAVAQAQLTADFSTTSYPAAPAWQGHTFAFGLEQDSLLRSQTIRSTYISTPNALALGAVWEFSLALDFNPSPSNRLRVYLVSDTDTLTAPLKGYFIQLGENGNTDRYELYKQTGDALQLLLRSSPKSRLDPARINDRVRVVRDSLGHWELLTAIDTATTFTSEGVAWDFDHTETAFFGVHCLFTLANSNKFGFRYFLVDTNNTTITSPASPFLVQTATVATDTTLRVAFDRELDTATGSDTANYLLDKGYGHPVSVAVADSLAMLTFSQAFVSANYTLSIENVTDTAGVAVEAGTSIGFSYTAPPMPETKLMPDDTVSALFFDDFSTGIEGHWVGDTASLYVSGERLRLDTSTVSPAVVHASSDRLRNTIWEAGMDIEGALSGSNFVRLYLATSDDPVGAHQGYHLQIDGSSGNHSYRLWRQNGANRTSVFQSTPLPNQDGKFRARVRVICDADGGWSVWADEYDSGTFGALVNSAGDSITVDQTYNASAYLGYQASFTASRREDFKLDYLLVRQHEDIPDTPDPLIVDSAESTSDTTLRVVFVRTVDSLSGATPANYLLDNGYGHPASATVADSVVTLVFGGAFASGDYLLSIENVTDTAGVAVEAGTSIGFSYTAPPMPETKLMPDDTVSALFFNDFSTGIEEHWLGDTASLYVSAERLRLDTSAVSPAVVHVASDRLRNTVWEAGVDIEGALSGSNFVRLYLAASDDPAGAHQGYHLQIDGSSGNHSYRIWRQNGASRTSVFQSAPVPNQDGKFRARVRVICDADGGWSVWADEYDNGTFGVLVNSAGDSTAVDQTYSSSSYLGYQASFTASRRGDFKLDYVLVRQYEDIPVLPDPLIVDSLTVPTDTTLRVVFGRMVDSLSGTTPANYTLDNGYGHPASATVADSVVTLVFGRAFVSANYTLSIENVTDTAGVAVEAGTSIGFSYTAPTAPETKLMPDDTISALFFDDFSEGILSYWIGDTASLYVSGERLRLDTSAVSPAVVHAVSDRLRNTVWEAGVDIEGALSGSNFVRLYLAASDDPAGAHQGYHLQIDGSSGNHSYRIWRQNGASRTSVFQSAPMPNQDDKFRARVRVIYDTGGQWSVWADEYDSGTFVTLLNSSGDSTVTDQTYITSSYLGYQASFTASRRADFKLDYLLVRQHQDIPAVPDPLIADSITVQNDTTLRVAFSRAIDSLSGATPANYTLDNGYDHPASATGADSVVTLVFSATFVSGDYLLSIENVTDTAGVAVEAGTSIGFSYTVPPMPETKLMPDDTVSALFFDDFRAEIEGHWTGDTASLYVSDERLRLDTNATSPTVVHAPSDRLRNTVWEAGVDIEGALSGSNFVRLYLAASDDPAGAHQGYHLQIDGSSGNHSYRIWRQNGASRTSVFQSTPMPNQDGKFRARVRVICDTDGGWSVWADEYDDGTFVTLLNSSGDSTVIDQTYTTSSYLGYQASFTASRRVDFKLDYLLVQQYEDIPVLPDLLTVNSAEAANDTTLRVAFNRAVDSLSGSSSTNYTLDNGYGRPASTTVADSVVTLVFSNAFVSADYTLSIENVTDTAGVAVEAGTSVGFSYTAPPIPETKLAPDDTVSAHFFDDFSEGIQSYWIGDTASLYVSAERLRLDTSAVSPAVVHAVSVRLRNTVWEAGIDIEGALSGSNFVRLYLAASDDPVGAHQGYHLQIDGSSGNHSYRIWRQNGASRTSVFQSAPIPNQDGKFRARVRVVCDIDGQWSVWADEYDSGVFESLSNSAGDSTAVDQTYSGSSYLGYQASFTASRRADFKLDYVLVRQYEDIPVLPDPLTVNSAEATSDTTLRVVFVRTVDSLSGATPTNYLLDNGYGHPASATVADSVVTLVFGGAFASGDYLLSIENVTDTAGVAVEAGTSIGFSYTAPPALETKLVPDHTTGAYFFDDFSAGLNAFWLGDTSSLYVAGERLRLDTSAVSPTLLYAPSDRLRNTVWEGGVDVNGALSGSNFVRLYLAASDDPAGAHQGYHLQIDGSSGNHSYRIWRQNGASRTSVFQSVPVPNQDGKFRARVRVICDADGGWSIWADEYDSGVFESLSNSASDSTAVDQTYNASAYLGYQASFTASRRADFKLDYLLVRQYEDIPVLPDPLIVDSLTIPTDTTLRVVFGRMVDSLSGTTPANYTLDNGYGHPASATVADSVVTLVFSNAFISANYTLSVENVTDTAGVAVEAGTSVAFSYTAPPIPETKLAPDHTIGVLFFDDFSTGIEGHWLGDTTSLYVSDARLRLDTSAVSPAVVHAASDRLRNTVWEAGVDVNGALSGSNFVRLYLASSDDPAGAHQGYHLQIDGSSGNHSYRIWRQNGASRTSVFQSMPVPNQDGKFRARVRVICDADGQWSVWADEYDNGTFGALVSSAGDSTAVDQTYNASAYLGYQVSFTASRRADFKLDYLLVRLLEEDVDAALPPDTIPPAILSVDIIDSMTVNILFDKMLASLSETAHFSLQPGDLQPQNTVVTDDRITLVFASPFAEGAIGLTITGVRNIDGYAMASDTTITVAYQMPYAALPLDVVINEIMANPNGAHGLPEQEYIELYNRTQKTISLAGWTYQSLTTSVQLGDLSIPPGGYLVLCRQTDIPDFSPFGTVAGLSPWPALANNGTTLRLLNPEGLTVDEVAYLPAWYRNAQKRQGGWSLERIAPGAACLGSDNWMASNDPRGGSPGVENSVFDGSMDWPLEVKELRVIDNQHIRILFSKDIDIVHAGQASTYQLDQGVGHPDAIEIIGPREATLHFASPLAEGMAYTLLIGAMPDCLGNPTPLSHSFFLPHSALPGEILVNEILFNPKTDGVDFVELYNYSEKTFDLQALDIANVNASGQIAGHRRLAATQTLFQPHTYLLLTTAPATVKAHYPLAVEEAFLAMPSLPAFPNAGGNAVILSQGRVIDSLAYTASMHAAFIVDPKGVSLEREAFHVPTNAIGNFRSASTEVGGATPGFRNSQANHGEQTEGIYLTSRTFSPDDDGFEDRLEINYRFVEGGLMANIDVYNDKGVLVRRLVRNQSLARQGTIEWDGVADGGRRMPVGIYIAVIEIYHAAGTRRLYRESFVLASRF